MNYCRKSKQVTEQGAVSLAAPFLMQQAAPLTPLRGEKAADSNASWALFQSGIQLPSDAQKWPSKCVTYQNLSLVLSVIP